GQEVRFLAALPGEEDGEALAQALSGAIKNYGREVDRVVWVPTVKPKVNPIIGDWYLGPQDAWHPVVPPHRPGQQPLQPRHRTDMDGRLVPDHATLSRHASGVVHGLLNPSHARQRFYGSIRRQEGLFDLDLELDAEGRLLLPYGGR